MSDYIATQEQEALRRLEAVQSLRAQYACAKEEARLLIQEAMRELIRPGDIVDKFGGRDSPPWLSRIQTTVGNDRNAQQFEIAGAVTVDLHESQSSLSVWRAKAYALSKDGKRISGRTHHGLPDGSIRITGDICLNAVLSEESREPHQGILEAISAAAARRQRDAATPEAKPSDSESPGMSLS